MDTTGQSHPAAGATDAELRRRERKLWLMVGVACLLVLAATAAHVSANPLLLLVTACLTVVAWQRQLLAWPVLLSYVLVVILLIPIRRYTISASLPFQLEPYRLLIGVVLIAWLASLLVDPRTRFLKIGIEWPVLAFIAGIVLSLGANASRVAGAGIGAEVIKQLSFMAGFLLVMYFTNSIVTSRTTLDRLLVLIVGGGAIVAVLSIIEWRTGNNLFNQLQRVIPILHLDPAFVGDPLARGSRVRAYGSAQHPIALGALLVMLMPLAIYLHKRTGKNLWMGAAAVLTLGALATGSRTVALMLVALLAVFLWLKRKETIRLSPMLIPMIIVAQIAMPGTLGTFKAVLFPENGSLISEQEGGAGSGTGRVADLGPSLNEWAHHPLFGQGFGTRLTSPDDKFQNAQILDDEWLSTLLELGLVGTLALLWMYVRGIRLLGRRAKRDTSPDGWLLTALASGLTAFGVGMLTYDGFSFIQVTVISFILLGLGGAALRLMGPAPKDAAEGGGGDPLHLVRTT